MAGYNWSKGKSNNAVIAEENGLLVASKFAKWVSSFGGSYAGCTALDVHRAVEYEEWHHTSKFFNKVNYYSKLALADSDTRQKLKEEIRQRKEFESLSKRHLKLGHKCLYAYFEGIGIERWYNIVPANKYTSYELEISRLRDSIRIIEDSLGEYQ